MRKYRAFVLINLKLELRDYFGAIKKLKKIKNISEMYEVYGVYDAILKVESDSMRKLRRTIKHAIEPISGVTSILALIILESDVPEGWTITRIEPRETSAIDVQKSRRTLSRALENTTKDYLRLKYKNVKIISGEKNIHSFLRNVIGVVHEQLKQRRTVDFIIQNSVGYYLLVEITIGKDLEYKVEQLRSMWELLGRFKIQGFEIHLPRPYVLDSKYKVRQDKLYVWNGIKKKFDPIMIGHKVISVKTHEIDRLRFIELFA